MDFFYSIVGFFASGGVFMYPILVVFAVGLAIGVLWLVLSGVLTSVISTIGSNLQSFANSVFT